jgi:regulator of nonsense transcripts 2
LYGTSLRLVSSQVAFKCLKSLLEDFSHHNVEVTCALLESCGRYLVKSPDTAQRASAMLDIFTRLKSAKNLDARTTRLADSAYNACRPPEVVAKRGKIRPPVHEYVRHLVFIVLKPGTETVVVRQLRKLNWSEHESYVLKCLLKTHRGRHANASLVATVITTIGKTRQASLVKFVDAVLEDVRFGLEMNKPWMHQRRVATIRLLGELYNRGAVTSPIIFNTLYLLVSFGHDDGPSGSGAGGGSGSRDAGAGGGGDCSYPECDLPNDTIRVRLACTLLETCGRHFDRNPLSKTLDRFLPFFQRYVLSKEPNLEVSYDVVDLLKTLRPRLVPCETYEAAAAECARVEHEEAAKARAKGKFAGGGGGKGGKTLPPAPNGLGEIAEEDEEDEDDDDDEEGEGEGEEEEEEDFDDAESSDGESEEENVDEETRGVDGEDEDDSDGGSESESETDSDSDSDEDSTDADTDADADANAANSAPVELAPEERVKRVVPKVSKEVEADFDREMSKFLGPGIVAAKTPVVASYGQTPSTVARAAPTTRGPGMNGPGPTVAFKMLVKKDGKPASRTLDVPAEAEFVARVKEQAEAEQRERAELKRLVLMSAEADDGGAAPMIPKIQNARAPVLPPGGGRGGGGGGGRGRGPRRPDAGSGLSAGLHQLGQGGGQR